MNESHSIFQLRQLSDVDYFGTSGRKCGFEMNQSSIYFNPLALAWKGKWTWVHETCVSRFRSLKKLVTKVKSSPELPFQQHCFLSLDFPCASWPYRKGEALLILLSQDPHWGQSLESDRIQYYIALYHIKCFEWSIYFLSLLDDDDFLSMVDICWFIEACTMQGVQSSVNAFILYWVGKRS